MQYFRKFQIFAILIVFTLLIPREVFAYLDPGSGSYILQIIIGAFFAGLLAIKIFWKKAREFFGKIFNKE